MNLPRLLCPIMSDYVRLCPIMSDYPVAYDTFHCLPLKLFNIKFV